MKKNVFFLTALATVALLSSCSEDETVSALDANSSEIGFKTYVPKLTRATSIGDATALESTNFDVFAFLKSSGTQLMGKVSDGAKVVYATSKWDYDQASEKAYWPMTGNVDFYAVSPETADGLTKNFTSRSATLAYVTPVDNTLQTDLMYASVINASKNDRNGDGSNINAGGVKFNFRHALSQVVFKCKTDADAIQVDVESVEIHNVANSGTFTYPIVSTNAATGTTSGIWTVGATRDTYATGMVPVENIGTTSTDLTSLTGACMLIPQTLTKWNTTLGTAVTVADADNSHQGYLKIQCKIKNVGGGMTDYLLGTASDFATIYLPFGATWDQSKRYIYTLVFGKTNGQSGGGGFDSKGNPVLNNVQISFEPTVESWTDMSEGINL